MSEADTIRGELETVKRADAAAASLDWVKAAGAYRWAYSLAVADRAALERRAEQAEAALREARELLVMERSWAGCFCAVQNPDGTHDADCTWPAWLARYEAFIAATTPGEPE